MIYYESDSSVVYDDLDNFTNSYATSYTRNMNNSIVSSFSREQSKYNSNEQSRDNSRNNSYENNFLDTMISNIKVDRFKRLQKKNSKLKYKIVLEEIKRNKIKDELYKVNYKRVLDEINKIQLNNKVYKLQYDKMLHELYIKKNRKVYINGLLYLNLFDEMNNGIGIIRKKNKK